MKEKNMILDDGFMFGLGAFETILIKNGQAVFLCEHLKRLSSALRVLKIKQDIKGSDVLAYIEQNNLNNTALKIMVSEENIFFTVRDSGYKEDDFQKGMRIGISPIIRNETSPFTYLKSLNFADNIWEKRQAKESGYDEPLFLNTKGEITEGATSNIFFVKGNDLYTPDLKCGMINGIVRGYVIEKYDAFETIISQNEVQEFDEIFITNSLLGIMPIVQFEDLELSIGKITCQIRQEYERDI
ncbi:aminotransferase class IV [Dehalobacterium formicoaceticum]|uniref:Aminotransferase class IV n=1 Tax=Dehalobacterium formicoaceticum TaxID=51515 RepID=A0ABT1Y6Z2_9FIRM|nr:aminotransferase class IV [Dehalobacterium formicoaceticum]MCR6546658.1 aminotransferase class IV [Dehalobacterium formicoaceticum]